MSFFNSDIVRAEMVKIAELQEEVYGSVLQFPHMSNSDKIYHVELMQKLIDKQKVLYARLSLSDDPEAVEMRKKIRESAVMMGLPPNVDMSIVLKRMSEMLEVMRKQIDIQATE
jgi:mannose-6-phosphate isomerase class I